MTSGSISSSSWTVWKWSHQLCIYPPTATLQHDPRTFLTFMCSCRLWCPRHEAGILNFLLVRAELSDCFGGWKLKKSIIIITIAIIVISSNNSSHRTRGPCAAAQPTACARGSQPWAIWTGLLCTAWPAMGASCPGAARAHCITQQAPTSSSAIVK